MTKHTAQSLAKYLGKKVWVDIFYDGKSGTLHSVENENRCVVDFEIDVVPFGSCENIYPILKTVYDLTEDEIYSVYGKGDYVISDDDKLLMNFASSPSRQYIAGFKIYTQNHHGFINATILNLLLNINAGAIPSKESPTGYVSIFDNLPCKRWSEVFE